MSVKENLDSQYRIKISIGIGAVCDSIGDVGRSFAEARNVLSNITTRDRHDSFWYRETKHSVDRLYYPLATEERLIHVMKAGMTEEAEKITDTLFKKNFNARALSAKNVSILIDEIRGSISRAILETNIDESQISALQDGLARIESYPYAEDIFAAFKEAFRAICDAVNGRKKTENDIILGLIEEYIKSNFYRAEFCLSKVADEFNYNENYFSQYFKRHTGKTFSAYVDSIRLEYTRMLMENSEKTVEEIATEAGYLSTSTFYRTFRKKYGCSPSSYRRKLT